MRIQVTLNGKDCPNPFKLIQAMDGNYTLRAKLIDSQGRSLAEEKMWFVVASPVEEHEIFTLMV